MDFANILSRDHIASSELLESDAQQGSHFQGVDLHQISGLGRLIFLGFSHRQGRGRAWERDAVTPLRRGSISKPRCLSRCRMRPTIEVET